MQTKVRKIKDTSLKIEWNKIVGAESYSVYVAKKNTINFRKVATVKSTRYVFKKAKKSQNYYIYVKANKVKGGTKKYGSTKPQYLSIQRNRYGVTDE